MSERMTVDGHTLTFATGWCSCGWKSPLGLSVWRSFDLHIRMVRVTQEAQEAQETQETQEPTLRCANTQCRVETFTGDRCPACYGAPT